jgi:methylphosphotriester-DNA--protein-cysteine methyltransferase
MKILITEQQFNSLLLNEGAKSLWWKEIKQAVKLVNNIDEFEIKFNQLYDSARKQGLVSYIKTLFYDKMTPEQIKQEILDGYIDENGKLVKYKGREDLRVKNRRLYDLSRKISKKYNLTKGVDDILTQAFPLKYGFNLSTATVEQVLGYIESMGYKTNDEFITKSKTVYTKIPNEVRGEVMKHLEKKERNYNYKYGFNVETATFEQVLDYIESMGYKTKDEFRGKSYTVYSLIPNEVREKVMKHLEKKERDYNYKYGFNLSTATFEQVLDYIKSMGYKTKDEFITKSNTVYDKIPNEVREKVMKQLERTYKENYKYGFNLSTATFEQVLDYIKSMGYKTKDEFRSKSKTVYDKIPNEVREKVMKQLERTYKENYKYGFNLSTATFEQVLDYIESMGYKTKNEFITKSPSVYNQIPNEVREKVMKQLERTYKEKKQYYNNQTSSNPNISFKYSVKESVNKILKTMI